MNFRQKPKNKRNFLMGNSFMLSIFCINFAEAKLRPDGTAMVKMAFRDGETDRAI